MKVKRQDEPQLVKAVKELCEGRPSEETSILLKSLDRPISNIEADPVMLFGVNFDVEYMNQERIEAMQGLPTIYTATDSGMLFSKHISFYLWNIIKQIQLWSGQRNVEEYGIPFWFIPI